MSDYFTTLRNAAHDDPEQPDVVFYPVTTMYDVSKHDPRSLIPADVTPDEAYDTVLSGWGKHGAMNTSVFSAAVIEGTWYRCLQPEYKAYPAIIAALVATKIEIGCEHLKMPFPAFAIRLPEDFMREEGGPPIRCVFVCMLRNTNRGARPVTSIDSRPAPDSMEVPFNVGTRAPAPSYALMIQVKFKDKDGDDAFGNFAVMLKRGQTLEQSLADWITGKSKRDEHIRDMTERTTGYYPSDKMVRELLSLAVGVSFFATGRHKARGEILQDDKRPRHERRRFEREHDGQEQPTFTVGRDLVLPRESGAPGPDGGPEPGEGAGRSLRWAHYRTGHLRYQPHGSGLTERKLIFVEPTLVRPDLPLGTRVTPGRIVGGRPAHDVTDGGNS